ncbi:MAG: hypothetical protein M0002_01185 [Rhodospirillales bacterium]|nr:hypothetical protein [Rhodospirillales bacterium]
MPSELAIPPMSSVPPAEPSMTPDRKVAPEGAALAAMVPQIPSVVLNPEKGVVVIDFRNDAGAVINSIPTAQQLAAYGRSPPQPSLPALAEVPGKQAGTMPASSPPATQPAASSRRR